MTLKVFVDSFFCGKQNINGESERRRNWLIQYRFQQHKCASIKSGRKKGISEAVVGLEADFVLTTRNAEGEQCYDERDCVTVEIRIISALTVQRKHEFKITKMATTKSAILPKKLDNFNYQ